MNHLSSGPRLSRFLFHKFGKIFGTQGAPLLSTITGTVNRKSVESEGFLIFCLDTIANQLTLLDKLFTFYSIYSTV
jgi:hypothetical protein